MNLTKSYLLLLSICLGFISASTNAEISARAEHEIKILCEQLFADYAVYIDHLDAEGFANTFARDGELARGSNSTIGREDLKQYIEEHGDQAHLIMFTTSDIEVLSETEAVGSSYGLILNGDRPVKAGDDPVQMNGITAASEYRAQFKLTDEGWKISRMESEGVFIGPGFVK